MGDDQANKTNGPGQRHAEHGFFPFRPRQGFRLLQEAQLVAHPGKPERGGATGGAGFDEVMLLG